MSDKEFMKGKSEWRLNDWKRHASQLHKDLKCMELRARTLAKMLHGYVIVDADRSKNLMTESERAIIENSRQVIISFLEWI